MEKILPHTNHNPHSYQVSKFLYVDVLLSQKEMQALIEFVENPLIAVTGQVLDETSFAEQNFIETYTAYIEQRKSFGAFFWTKDPNALVKVPLKGEQFLIKPIYPVVQVQGFSYQVLPDKRYQSMVFGKKATPWGVRFSFPTLFIHPETKSICEVWKETSPNRDLFRAIQKWMRMHTKPVFLEEISKTATFRQGKEG